MRDDLRDYVVKHIGQPDGVLILDETGFLKKGDKSAGVGRQYSGTAGRIENCQIGVFLAYHSTKGTALIDRALYLPKAWTEDKARCREAGIPDDVVFATKPELARTMIRRVVKCGIPARWVIADEAYGIDHKFRRFIEDSGLSYVVAVACSQRLFLGGYYDRADVFASELPDPSWKRLSCGAGSKGRRTYDWAFIEFPFQAMDGFRKGLLIRRSISDPNEKAYYLCRFARSTTVEELVAVAGCRWGIEICFEQSKGEVGLDNYEVRSWDGWRRHFTLVMFAYAFLVAIRANAAQTNPPKSEDLLS